ncbi:MAG: AI-2E family transporter, partial [Bdellovibrionota bacterium]
AVRGFMSYLTDFFSVDQAKLIDMGQDLARGIGIKAADLLGEMVAYLPSMMMAMAVMMLSIYFFLVDGRSLAFFIRRNSFFGSNETDQLIQAVVNMCRSVILASVVSAVSQAFVFTIVAVAAGVPNPAFVGTLVLIASFIPIVGSAPITIGVAIQAFISGNSVTGVVLLIAAFVVSGIDNFIRPVFLKGSTNLHPMLAFLAALGGLQSVGFLGVFLGPIVAALFVVTVEILTQPNDQRTPT